MRCWMNELDEVVENDWPPGPAREWGWVTYRLTFAEAIPRIFGHKADALLEHLLLSLPEEPPEPGQTLEGVIKWEGFGLIVEMIGDPDSDQIDTHVRIETMLDLFDYDPDGEHEPEGSNSEEWGSE